MPSWFFLIDDLTHLPLVPHICVSESGSALVQIMACHLFSTKQLSKPMLGYYQLDLWEQTSVNFQNLKVWNQNTKSFIHKNAFENIVRKWPPFWPGRDELTHCGILGNCSQQNVTGPHCWQVNNGSDNDLVLNMQQTITLTNVDQDVGCLMASLHHIELKLTKAYVCVRGPEIDAWWLKKIVQYWRFQWITTEMISVA